MRRAGPWAILSATPDMLANREWETGKLETTLAPALACLSCLVMLLSACHGGTIPVDSPLATGSPLRSPPPSPPPSAGALADDYLRRQVGATYFEAHFVPLSAEAIGGLIKATYLYSYAPYVADQDMTLFLSSSTLAPDPESASTVLLSAQEFALDPDQALAVAFEHGIDSDGPHRVELAIGPQTAHRFAWRVTGPASSAVQAPPGSLLLVAIDVETGEVVFSGTVGVDQSH